MTDFNDVADAIGSVDQNYFYSGFSVEKSFGGGMTAFTHGGSFADTQDDRDNNQCDITCDRPVNEGPKNGSLIHASNSEAF